MESATPQATPKADAGYGALAQSIGLNATDGAFFALFGAVALGTLFLCMIASYCALRKRMNPLDLDCGNLYGLCIVACLPCPYRVRIVCGIPEFPRQAREAKDKKRTSGKKGTSYKDSAPPSLKIARGKSLRGKSFEGGDSSDSDGAGTGVLAAGTGNSARRLTFTPSRLGDDKTTGEYGYTTPPSWSTSSSPKRQLRSAIDGSDAETKLTPIVVDAARLQRDPQYKQWYTENRAHILEHNKLAFSSAASANRQSSLRGGMLAALTPSSAGMLTPTGKLTRGRTAVIGVGTPRKFSDDMSPAMSPLPPPAVSKSSSHSVSSSPLPQASARGLQAAMQVSNPPPAPAGFVVDQERLRDDPAYREWYEANKAKLHPQQSTQTASATQATRPTSLLGALKGGSRDASQAPRLSAGNSDASEQAAASQTASNVDLGQVNGHQPSSGGFVPDPERLATEPEYRQWYETHRHQLDAAARAQQQAAIQQTTSDQQNEPRAMVANPLHSRKPASSTPTTSAAHEAQAPGAAAFVVDRQRLKEDPAYAAWYEKHKHRLNSGFKSSALARVLHKGSAGKARQASQHASTVQSSLSPLAAARSDTTEAPTENPRNSDVVMASRSGFQVDQERLQTDAGYRLWYEQHKHLL